MPVPDIDVMDVSIGVDELIRKSEVFDYIEAAIAILDDSGGLVYQNNAFKKLDIPLETKIPLSSSVVNKLDVTEINSSIQSCIQEKSSRNINLTYYYDTKIPLKITVMLRPIFNNGAAVAEGVLLTIGEESVDFDNRHLARLQHTELELRERIRTLSKEQIAQDNLVRSLLKKTPFGIMLVDAKRNIIQINTECEKILNVSSRNAMGHFCDEFLHCYQQHQTCPIIDNGRAINAEETTCVHSSGTIIPILRSTVLLSHMDEPVIMESFIDITERKHADEKMLKLSSALEQTADSVVITDPRGIIEFVNPAFEETTGFSREDVLGKTPRVIKSGEHDENFYSQLWQTILSGKVYRDVMINRKKDGVLYYEEKTITPLLNNNNEITNYISTGKDITDRIQDQERLNFLAHHDALTKLPNRALLMERLEHALIHCKRRKRSLAVLFLDIDRFKSINDSLGHAIGDKILSLSAERFSNSLRKDDTVARLGGDEFAILLEDIRSSDEVVQVVRNILNIAAKPITIEGRDLIVTSSIGIALFPEDGDSPGVLMKNADIAMYRAKEQGRNNYQFYSEDMGKRAFEHLIIENNLHHALEREEFLLHYQPQIDLLQSRMVGAEALIRWQHPELGMVSPVNFIPVLEETGLIVPVGKWVLETACAALRKYINNTGNSISISVNMSSRQFSDPQLPDYISQALDDHALKPELLDIEITESVLIEHNNTIMENFSRLAEMGVSLSLDDFGTGYSSLSYLKRFPINTLKIDRSFIHDVDTDSDDAEIVKAILAMAKSMNLKVVAEGIETEQQLDFIKKYNCNIAQGYLFSQAIPEADLEEFKLNKS